MDPSIRSLRLKLIPFWISNSCRSIAENSIRVYALLLLRDGAFQEHPIPLVFLWIALCAAPAIFLAPLVGAIAGSKFRHFMMIFGGIIGLTVVALTATKIVPLLSCVGFLVVEGIFFAACRQATLLPVSKKCLYWFPNLNALFAIGTWLGILIGIWFGLQFEPSLKTPDLHFPLPIQAALIGYGVMILCLLISRFEIEIEWTAKEGLIIPFVRSIGEIVRDRYSRIGFLLLLPWFATFLLLVAKNNWLMDSDYSSLNSFGVAFVIGLVIGGYRWHPYRTSWIVPPAWLLLSCFLLYSAWTEDWMGPVWWFGILLGCIGLPLLNLYQDEVPEKRQANGLAYLFACLGIVGLMIGVLFLANRYDFPRLHEQVSAILLLLSIGSTIYAWLVLFRPFVESISEFILKPFQRVEGHGPGFFDMPWKGPSLVIANHGAMLDPCWLAQLVPHRTTPMMISIFYDLPVISWLVRRVVRAIRVQDSFYRREAPEIQEAIERIRQGENVMIFPEGWLRRREEVPMRRFSRGVWQILKACPNTPVYACWIEGGWGSFFSHKDGPPMRNKRMDFWRRIKIAAIRGRIVPPEILENHLQTRRLLMEWVLEARAILGLPPIDITQVPQSDRENNNNNGEVE